MDFEHLELSCGVWAKRITLLALLLVAMLCSDLPCPAQDAGSAGQTASPVSESSSYNKQGRNADLQQAQSYDSQSPAQNEPNSGGSYQVGMGFSEQTVPQALQTNSDGGGGASGAAGAANFTVEVTNTDKYGGPPMAFSEFSRATGGESGADDAWLKREEDVENFRIGTPGSDALAGLPFVAGPGGGKGIAGTLVSNAVNAVGLGHATSVASQMAGNPKSQTNQVKANQTSNQASSASCSGEDAIQCLSDALDGADMYLINVANEDAAAPCSSHAVSKTYANTVFMVQKMYKRCFIYIAILFLLPGALITNAKTLVGFAFLQGRDEDFSHPLTGILRSIIAIFLIFCTPLIVSYMVDLGNCLHSTCKPYVNIPLIMLWAQEQVQIFKPEQQGKPIKNLPTPPLAPWRGKFAGMPVGGAILEQISGMDAALSELANECLHYLAMSLTIVHGFQVVLLCYLYLMGPLAAALFAWPGLGRDLFRRAFASWLDGVVVLTLWKFWWHVVLIVMTVRCESGSALNPFDPFEVYYLVAFVCILMFVPFNPFDFKPGEIVTQALEKAQAVAAKVAQKSSSGGH